jgi:hypothetical protein
MQGITVSFTTSQARVKSMMKDENKLASREELEAENKKLQQALKQLQVIVRTVNE